MIGKWKWKNGTIQQHVKITEGYEDNSHPIQAYTDGSTNDLEVGGKNSNFLRQ